MDNEKINGANGRDMKEEILNFLKNRGNNITTQREIEDTLNISKPTCSKYLLVLEAEKKIKVKDYGNVKLYYNGDLNEKE